MKVWIMQGRFESELFSSVHLTEKGCVLACIEDVMQYHGIESDEEALRVMNDVHTYSETDGEQMEPLPWDHNVLKDMTRKELWKVFNQWCDLSWEDFSERCYDIQASCMDIQA